jgi:hypothetical protein
MSDLLREAVGDGVSIETILSSSLWTVSADVSQLETAILDVAINFPGRDATGKLTSECGNVLLMRPMPPPTQR